MYQGYREWGETPYFGDLLESYPEGHGLGLGEGGSLLGYAGKGEGVGAGVGAEIGAVAAGGELGEGCEGR